MQHIYATYSKLYKQQDIQHIKEHNNIILIIILAVLEL